MRGAGQQYLTEQDDGSTSEHDEGRRYQKELGADSVEVDVCVELCNTTLAQG